MHNIRSPLYDERYRPTFSGHETFPLRYGWLKKAYDAVAATDDAVSARDVFSESAIARFGVGKNMVTSMRHWATACGVIADTGDGEGLRPTEFGEFIFGPKGLDPYLEHPATLWLLHWQLASYGGDTKRLCKTTWHWVINHFPGLSFEKEDLVSGLMKLAEDRKWSRLAPVTIKNDVDCFIRTYEARSPDKEGLEDALSSPLSELGLIRGHHRRFQLIRGPKRSLPNAVFVYALEHFWRRLGQTKTMSFELVAHEPGSPGRTFLLDEADLGDRLVAIEDASAGAFRWSETAGLKQVLRAKPLSDSAMMNLLKMHCMRRGAKEAA